MIIFAITSMLERNYFWYPSKSPTKSKSDSNGAPCELTRKSPVFHGFLRTSLQTSHRFHTPKQERVTILTNAESKTTTTTTTTTRRRTTTTTTTATELWCTMRTLSAVSSLLSFISTTCSVLHLSCIIDHTYKDEDDLKTVSTASLTTASSQTTSSSPRSSSSSSRQPMVHRRRQQQRHHATKSNKSSMVTTTTTTTTASRTIGTWAHTKKKNQLVKAVSPFDELLIDSHQTRQHRDDANDSHGLGSFPFDEIIVVPKKPTSSMNRPRYRFEDETALFRLQEQHKQQEQQPQWQTRRHEESNNLESREPLEGARAGEEATPITPVDLLSLLVPATIQYPSISTTTTTDEESALSCEVDSEVSFSARTLTPHPSFDGSGTAGGPKNKNATTMTAHDFHHLYQVSRKLEEEQDWPSDEDGYPWLLDNCEWNEEGTPTTTRNTTRNNGMTLMILNDLDETLSRRETSLSEERCEI